MYKKKTTYYILIPTSLMRQAFTLLEKIPVAHGGAAGIVLCDYSPSPFSDMCHKERDVRIKSHFVC